jgi:hypothetical protein
MYFDNFPKFLYDFEINGEKQYILVKDITTNVRLRKEILSNITVYDEYDIKEGETPEIIAEKVYGSALYHWVIMICNERYDYIADFPLASYELENYIKQKYGDAVYDIHHYVDSSGYIVDSTTANATSVSNYDHEVEVNESKRRIKLISPKLLGTILKNFKDLV